MIKICGITNLEDALAAIQGGATALGFNFYRPSKRYIAPETAALILEALPAHITKVGVFVNEPPAAIQQAAARLRFDVAQLHGDEQAAQVPTALRWWKAFRVNGSFDPAGMNAYREAEAFLLDGPAGTEYGGSGAEFAWSLASGIKHRIIIAGGLDASNVRQAIAQSQAWGVDACSRLESSPGRKDHRKMLEFLKAALSAEESL
ncbi:MAG: phosphoribosylanthranilate isomerase [Acidobacteria bacterium]|nr:phosphoribosylanthranilate isomerase [Acidobacteriota bacterium]